MAFGSVMMFVFRFVQTTGSRYVHLFSDMRVYFLCYLVTQCLVFLFVSTPANLHYLNPTQIKTIMKEVDPKIFALIVDEPLVFGISVSF
jgi:hypothetical protein